MDSKEEARATQNINELLTASENTEISSETTQEDFQEESSKENVETSTSNPDESPEEITETDTSNQTGLLKTMPEMPVIDDEIIQKYPTLKSYKGRPITEIAHAYDATVRQLNKISQRLKKKDIPKLEDMPDPYQNPDEAQQWLNNRDKQMKEDDFDYIGAIAARLPGDTDVAQLVQNWAAKNQKFLFDGSGIRKEVQAVFEKEPMLLVEQVVNHYTDLVEGESQKRAIEKKTSKQVYNTVKKSFNNEPEQIHKVKQARELDEVQALLKEINDQL